MTRLKWDIGPRPYEEGVDRGVLYSDNVGVVWNGLLSVQENDTGTVDETHYFDGVRRIVSQSVGGFEATLSAYTYPKEFGEYDGYSENNSNKRFDLSYRSNSKLHLVYNALAKSDSRHWASQQESLNLVAFAWSITTTPLDIPGSRPGSHLVIDLSSSEILEEVENILYGTSSQQPRMPRPEELMDIFETETVFKVEYINNIFTMWRVTGPDEMVHENSDGTFWISVPTAFILENDRFRVSSY